MENIIKTPNTIEQLWEENESLSRRNALLEQEKSELELKLKWYVVLPLWWRAPCHE
jgi:predicted RNase H-like nuclease (RuvC/YqgF family)